MHEWLISVPVWGERYVKIFCALGLPALRAAAGTMRRVVLIVHTEPAWRATLAAAAYGIAVEFKGLPPGPTWWQQMSTAHAQVLAMAGPSVAVMPLTADMVVSPETFDACEARFAQGKRLVLCCGIRAVDDGAVPDLSSSRSLLDWAWSHRHKLTDECIWPNGRSGNWTGIYFEQGESVIFRPRYPHPIAALSHGRGVKFIPTIDANYYNNFDRSEIHVVTDPDELSAIELSPREKALEFVDPTFAERVAKGKLQTFNKLSHWIFQHRVVIRGAAFEEGSGVVNKVPVRG